MNRISPAMHRLAQSKSGACNFNNHKVVPSRASDEVEHRGAIHHFKLEIEGIHVPEGQAYLATSTRRANLVSMQYRTEPTSHTG